MSYFRSGISALLLTVALTTSSFALAGIGFHWGNDFTLNMKETKQEWLDIEDLSLDTTSLGLGALPSGLTALTGKQLPIYLSRTDWERSLLNGGVKAYIDFIPFLDAIEVSTNFGLWQYNGSVVYPKSLTLNSINYTAATTPDELFAATYDTIAINYKKWGLDKTPYMKLQLDLTVRKFILKLPPVVNILNLYGGGGFSINFATPILSKSLVEKVIAKKLANPRTLTALGTDLFSNDDIVTEIRTQLVTPHYGCHIDAGVMMKIPLIPIGLYVDGKFLIPFDSMDNLGGYGLLVNSGISLSL